MDLDTGAVISAELRGTDHDHARHAGPCRRASRGGRCVYIDTSGEVARRVPSKKPVRLAAPRQGGRQPEGNLTRQAAP